MRKGLRRVLDLRRLLEERAGLDLQARTAELRRMEGQAKDHRRLSGATRGQAIEALLEKATGDAWLAMADAEILSWKSRMIEAAAQNVSEEVALLREHRATRHIERQQAETLVAEAAQVEERDRIRREQQQLDDWFQSLPSSPSRRTE